MSVPFEILPLRPFTQAEIWPIITGYETQEIYAVEKTETDLQTRFDIRLVQLEKPYRTAYFEDFTAEECQWYQTLLPLGHSFGAYYNGRLIGFALAEVMADKDLLRVWEFHVMAEFRRMGVGRALMEQVVAKAQQANLPMIMLETQNTNVKAIRFYRSMGFTLEAIDLSQYFNLDNSDASATAFFMKRWLKDIPALRQRPR
jgi:streptothricin acetyltransferase